jgi:hypothetical protein
MKKKVDTLPTLTPEQTEAVTGGGPRSPRPRNPISNGPR